MDIDAAGIPATTTSTSASGPQGGIAAGAGAANVSPGVSADVAALWARVGVQLRQEIGEDAYGSWLAPAALRTGADGALCLVTPTGLARDWIRRHAWRGIGEAWAGLDPLARILRLRARAEFEAEIGAAPCAAATASNRAMACAEDVPAVASGVKPACPAARASPEGLPERYRFDTFVTGHANEFAHAVARRVASWSDGHFNPVVFHGPFGFGKTHLLNAMAWEAMRNAPERKVVYLSSEGFLSGFVRAVMERRTAAFKAELRSADLLLIDDVHFIGGKQSTQEELFHTLAALMEDGRRVVFSADRPPSALTEIDPRLRSHLSSGLVCGIEAADRQLRLGILERKVAVLARQQGLVGGPRPEVLAFLADRFSESVRELEGALNTLIMCAGARIGALRLDEVECMMRPHLRGGERRITVDDIQKAASEHFGLKQADLISAARTRAVARPRQAAMWLTKQLTTRSLPDIGRRFGGRDHTTVLHAVRRIEALKATDPRLAADLETLIRKLRG